MWISEPKKRDLLDSLARQRRLTERRQKLESREVRRVEVKGKGSQRRRPPLLVESDVESDSDCDSQPDLDSVFEAGGGDEVMDEDLWKDHPIQRQLTKPSPKSSQALPVPAKPPEEAVPSEENTIKMFLMSVMAWVEDLTAEARERERR